MPRKILAKPSQISDEEPWRFVNMHTLDYNNTEMNARDVHNLVEALLSRTTPEAHSAGVIPISHLTITQWNPKLLQDDQNVLLKYKLGQIVPNLIILESDRHQASVLSLFSFSEF